MTSINHSNNLCLVTLLFLPSTSCHCPDHVPPRELDKKFGKILNPKNTSNNNPTNILNNLCDGLQTFLGFNSDSKGYDGQGIVYSDLDRLCDGVMAFLLSCLEGSKGLLEHYNPNITQTINDLKASIGKGRGVSGFAKAVGKVKSGLQGYEEGMTARTEGVSIILKTLSQTDIVRYKREIEDNKKYNLESQLKAVSSRAAWCLRTATNADGAVKQLDEHLRGKLQCAMKLVSQAANVFQDVANRPDVMEEAKAVDSGLTEQKRILNKAINDETKKLDSNLTSQFHDIEIAFNELSQTKHDEFGKVRNAMDEALDLAEELTENFNGTYREQINRRFYDVREKLVMVDSTSVQPQLRTDINEIRSKLLAVGKELGREAADLAKWNSSAADVVKYAMNKCKEILMRVDIKTESGKHVLIKTNAVALKTKAERLLKAYESARRGVGALVAKVTTAVEHIEKAYRERLQTIKIEVVAAVKEALDGKDNSLTALDEHVKTDLENVRNKIRDGINRYIDTQIIAILKAAQKAFEVGHNNLARTGLYASLTGEVKKLFASSQADRSKNVIEALRALHSELKLSSILPLPEVESLEFVNKLKLDIENELQSVIKNPKNTIKYDEQFMNNYYVQTMKFGNRNGMLRGMIEGIKAPLNKDGFDEGDSRIEFKPADMTGYGSPSRGVSDNVKGAHGEYKEAIAAITSDTLSSFTADGEKAVTDTTKNGAADITEVGKQLKTIEDQLEKLSTLVNRPASFLDDGEKGVLILLTELDDMLKKNEKMHYGLRKSVTNIHERLTRMTEDEFTTIKTGIIQQAIDTALATVTELESLPAAVEFARKETDAMLNLLDNRCRNIQRRISDIDQGIISANRYLQSAIDKLSNALTGAKQASKAAVENLRIFALSAVKNAFSALTSQVQSLFAKQKQAELTALETVVTTQLAEIERVIEEDRGSGVKGFLTILKDGITNRLKGSTPVELSNGMKLYDLGTKVLNFFEGVFEYVDEEIRPRSAQTLRQNPGTQVQDPYATRVDTIRSKVVKLLAELKTFNHNFEVNSQSLINAVKQLSADTFGEGNHPTLLNIIKDGMTYFCRELQYAYINAYDGNNPIVWEKTPPHPAAQGDPTNEAMNCARIALTIIPMLLSEFEELLTNTNVTGDHYNLSINLHNNNGLGDFLKTAGYDVPTSAEISDAELKNKENFCGVHIHDRLMNNIKGKLINTTKTPPTAMSSGGVHIVVEHEEEDGLLQKLHGHLVLYFNVCHFTHIAKPRTPSSVYEMLAWCSGLQFNAVYEPLCQYFKELFKKPEDLENEPYKNIDFSRLSLAGTTTIQPAHLTTALRDVCAESYALLITILGNGHIGGKYGCEFSNNSFNLQYPAAPAQCFDMLVDVLNRLYEQLYFLFRQCRNATELSGWYDCHYGRYVGGSDWRCNDKQCLNQTCDQKCKQTRDQIHDQKGDQHPNCGLKSPLQSFLEDGLPGFLPHSFTKPGCKWECTVSNHRGIPCKTPMGFADISNAASHTQRGAYLMDVLSSFCGNKDSCLTKLCGYFVCLLQQPPQTLGDIFAFFHGYFTNWEGGFYKRKGGENRTQVSFNDAVKEAYFGHEYGFNPSIMFGKMDHENHTNGNLCSISTCKSESVKTCGLYLKPLTSNNFSIYSSEHKANHLSWIVYITETFYDLLKKLYDDCCKKCGSSGTKCHDKSCVEQCSVDYTRDTTVGKSLNVHHHRKCKSIVNCRDANPTLYRYGLSFGNTWALSGAGNTNMTKRTCKDFCEALKLMLGEKSVLITLRGQIDNFLWAIRFNFSITVLTLWLLSLLYLLHIMVIRLDLLHIKSHLHSPSSHRIAAQSLLAAARVNKLGRVFYLQP
ncbi:hypothetical protein, conserved [Babesia bigemina]|uniref:C3H1-type domain-containing protein n=1 Tax=Babesia bigemina TaxID=5866 RepID=A0A061BK16_BABBI|nr:hypothetical protein, conserved [Babesia bigemina]CDR71797.1 hypothetical protein, conserved [Babesia bigemina]|eukprot:XP_012770741.1 hypothetical protein, conserved [Babesia bigemina]